MGRPRKYKTEEERKKAKSEAQQRWARKNQDTVAYIRAKSFAKQFIEMSEDEDIELLEEWLEERKKQKKKDETDWLYVVNLFFTDFHYKYTM